MIFKYEICDSCETVAHCRAFGCVPIQPAQRKPAFHGFMDKENCTVNLCFTPWAPGGPNNELPTAYYTQPPAQRKPLTPEWIWMWLRKWCDSHPSLRQETYNSLYKMVSDARAIEAAHNIKN